ncbi:nitrilase-related carbon-nitrogen hydrolase [Streptomyces cavernicola]|uniref:Nitrilase-related carbon-nitrogen hydrolase n=1 Tax=Streptomyces cavernicola TaxID=3043613 RepID=A0ABT6SM96_9ACTN|nr:nitrilase-related carbon-nitrogen hydrolase [Streptomyces sp. B-S-A6]MDI3409024.1 nitrilase-related carbon-nitrogen hydrolase [Streptomyces sp. B-S-A6]
MIALIKPYGAVGLIPTVWGAESRADVKKNIDLLLELAKGAVWLSSLDVPVRLLVLPEGALQGFTDEIHDMPAREYAQTAAIDVPGPETDILARFAREQDLFILGQAKARHPDWPELFFNVGFLINPAGEIVLKHYKMSALSRSSVPFRLTTSTTGGSRSTGASSSRSGLSPTPRSGGSA